MFTQHTLSAGTLTILLSLAPGAQAQEQSPLAGPSVTSKAKPASLVERDFNGAVRRPERTPEEAAIAILTLSDAAKAKVEEVFDRRYQALDAFVAGNINLLTKFGVAFGTGNKLDMAGLGIEAFNKTANLRIGGSLWEQVRAALPSDVAPKFDALMNEYWDAVVAEGRKTKNEQGKERSRFEITTAEKLQIFGHEIEQSFNSQIYSGSLYVNALKAKVNLTQSQRKRIEELTLDFAKRTNFKPTDKDQGQLVIAILAVLDESQRAQVARILQGGD